MRSPRYKHDRALNRLNNQYNKNSPEVDEATFLSSTSCSLIALPPYTWLVVPSKVQLVELSITVDTFGFLETERQSFDFGRLMNDKAETNCSTKLSKQ